ncbi:hypothetical protein HK096_005959, partial [Nowakowskiella sp. JEL0078]
MFSKNTGLISVLKISLASANPLKIVGVIGIITLNSGDHLIVVTGREKAAELDGKIIYKLTGHQFVSISSTTRITERQAEDDKVFKLLLDDILGSKFFYFSYDFDLTHSLQRRAKLNKLDPLWKRADDRFFWNKPLSQKLVASTLKGEDASNFILPITVG